MLVVGALAGCLGSHDTPPDGSDVTAGAGLDGPWFPNGTKAPITHALEDCSELVAVLTVPADVFEGLVPPGFTVQGPAEGLATLIFVGQDCAWVDGSQVGIAKAYVTVEPPDAWLATNASGHALYLAIFTTSEDLAAVLTAWGLGPVVSVGDVALETTVTPAGGMGQLDASAGGETLTIDALVGGAEEAGIGPVTRMFVADEMLTVTGAVDLHPTEHAGVLRGTARITHAGFQPDNPLPTYAGQGLQFWGFGQEERYVELPPLEHTGG